MTVDEKVRTRLLLGGVGFAQGLVLWQVVERWPEGSKAWGLLGSVAMGAVTFGLVFHLCAAPARRARAGLTSAVTALALSALLYWTWWQFNAGVGSDEQRLTIFFLTVPLALYALLPYLQIASRRRPDVPFYTELFLHSWNNIFLLSLAGIFTGLFWALISLWAELFKLIGIEIFADIFRSKDFVWISTAAVFGTGMALSRENERVIQTIRSLALTLCRFLLPLFSIIATLFLLALPFTGVDTLWDTGFAASLLLALATLGILFLNGVVQEGTEAPPYVGPLRKLVGASILGLPILGGLAFHAVWLRFDQYGLTPDRFFAFLYAGLATLYGAGYALSLLLRGPTWMGALRPVNVALSFVVLFLLLAPHTPPLDPLRLSADQQFDRLVRGDAAPGNFDFGLLQFDLGAAGRSRLDALKNLARHPSRTQILKEIDIVRAAADRQEWNEMRGKTLGRRLSRNDLLIHPPGTPIPDPVLRAASESLSPYELLKCAKPKTCALVSLQLDDDAELEYVFLGVYGTGTLFDRAPGKGWSGVPLRIVVYGDRGRDKWILDIIGGDVGTLDPGRYRRIRIGGRIWEVEDDGPRPAPAPPRRDRAASP